MTRPFVTAALFVAAIAPSVASAATYSAKLIAPVAAKRIIVPDIVWACGPAACQGASESSRPLVLCQRLARQAGSIESFIVNGRALAAHELDKCNTAAKGHIVPALARAN